MIATKQVISITIPAYIHVQVEFDIEDNVEWDDLSEEEQYEIIFKETGKYPTLKHNDNFSVEDYYINEIFCHDKDGNEIVS